MHAAALFKIIRPVNSLAAGLAAVVAFLIATGAFVPSALLLVPVVALIAGAGNTINDYFDVEIDLINRPERPIPSGRVTRESALVLAVLLFLAGIGISFILPPICIAFAVGNSVILAMYAWHLKRTVLIGNLTVSYLAGSMFLFGGGLAGWQGLVANLPIATITFLAMIARELLKDAEDLEGDTAAGARTLPGVVGVRPTVIAALIFVAGAVVASIVPFYRWGYWYLAGILAVDAIILYAAVVPVRCITPVCIRKSRSTTLLKNGMFASLAVFIAAAILL